MLGEHSEGMDGGNKGKDISDFFAKRPSGSIKTGPSESKDRCEVARQERGDDDSALFSDLCSIFASIEQTTKRLEITSLLTGFFVALMKEDKQEDLIAACLLSLSRLGPEYEGIELGLGEALLVKALSQSTGRSTGNIKSEMEEKGDIGLVAEGARAAQKTMFSARTLTLVLLLKALRDVAKASGPSATGHRVAKVQGLLAACSAKEARFLFRLLAGKLRIGLAEQSVLIALGEADKIHHQLDDVANPGEIVKAFFHTAPNYELLIPALLKYSVKDLARHSKMTPGVPVKPMLAFPTKSMTEVLNRFENTPFTCEFKYDGERAQIHFIRSSAASAMMIFSRNSENMTPKYPDIKSVIIPEALLNHNVSFVIDCEVVAFDPSRQRLLPFQVLSTRKRKDVSAESVQVQVCLFAFDLLYVDERDLLQSPLVERRQLLHQLFRETNAFHFARSIDTETVEEMQTFLDEAIANSCEGLMVKVRTGPESSYEPSKRSRNWLKVKKDYLEAAGGDTVDLVVVGAYKGRGKRTGVYGGYLLACYDPETEEFHAVCKLGTGFSEQDLESLAESLKHDIIPERPSYVKVSDSIVPDVWFAPKQVWEVKAADMSLSPVYSAGVGLVDPARGISLRFPRFIRKRDDKPAEDASTPELLADMYHKQASTAPVAIDNDEIEY